ncbi:MAG: DUF2339 domain-containing protein, partial [Leptospiraceae bacterium]|nr:DUF2339 domain-containing protein [Leptospiraceae bacterium]
MGSELDHLEQKIAKLESEIFALRSELQQLRQKVKVGKQPVLANTMTTPVMLPPEAAPQQPAVRSQSWEWQIGGSMLGKIGVVTLILSAVLFTIYAFEQGWLSEWLRLLLLQIAGLAFALSSLQLHRRGYRHIPEVLNVAAFTANAIAIYSAHFIYGLISPGEAFGMVTTAMLLCLLLARRLHSPALVLLLLGAFFVLPAIHANVLSAPLAYFSYLVLVNLLYFMLRQTAVEALGAVGMHAFWIVVLGNTLSLGQWVGAHPHQILEPLIFITLYTAFFLWQGLRENWPQEQSKTLQLLAVLLTNFCSVALLFAILEKQRGLVPELRAMALLGVAALNVAVFAAAPRGKRRIEPIALVILILLSAAVFLLHEGNIQTLLLGLLAFPMLWAAARRGDTLLFTCATGLSFMNFVLFVMRISLHGGIPFFNLQFAVFVFYVAAAIVLQRRAVWPVTLNFSYVYAATAIATSFAGLWTELYRSTSNAELRLL